MDVAQWDAPLTVASFLQGLARTGSPRGRVPNPAAFTPDVEQGYAEDVVPPPLARHLAAAVPVDLARETVSERLSDPGAVQQVIRSPIRASMVTACE